MKILEYNREKVVEYAQRWALKRNPRYYNFDLLGGDCTNFVSQCLFAGAEVMNYNKHDGWFYTSLNNRAPAWTGVDFFYSFIVNNKGVGPFGEEVNPNKAKIGDIVQFGRSNGKFYHGGVIVGFRALDALISAHTFDVYGKNVKSYNASKVRYIHVIAVRQK